MKKIYAGVLLSLVFYNTNAQSFSWAKKGGLWAYDYGYGITTDNTGNVYLAGKYEKNANFNGTILPCQGNHDIYVAKYNPAGSLTWIRTAGGYTGDYATSVACDSKYLYVAGEIEGTNATIKFVGSPITLKCVNSNDIFLAKYDLNGNLIWARRAGGNYYEKALGITYDPWGNIYICGLYNKSATFGSSTTISGWGENDIFVAKYDANGNFLWVRKAGSYGRDEAKGIKCDAAGNVYICGLYKDGCTFGTQVLSAPPGYFNAFLAKYDPNGSLLWVKKGGGNYDDVFWSLAIDGNGKIFVAGEFNATATFSNLTISTTGSADILVGCYDANGTIQWVRKAGGKNSDRARGIATVGNKLYITGQFGYTAYFGSTTKTASDGSDIFISSLDKNGNFLWTSAAGGGADAAESLGYESGNTICAELNGNVYASGSMLNGASFGSNYLSAYSRTDVFITKLTSPPATNAGDQGDSIYARVDSSAADSVDEISRDGIHHGNLNIYPNPGSGEFTIDLCFGVSEDLEMMVFNSAGQVVEQKHLNTPCQAPMDFSHLEKGVYVVVIRSGANAYREKLVIQ